MQLTRRHAQRLRLMYRSAGWPYQDVLEVELLAAGLLERVPSTGGGCETLRVTDAGLSQLSAAAARNRAALSPHDALVEQVATSLTRAGRLAWRGLMLRVPLAQRPAHSESKHAPVETSRALGAIDAIASGGSDAATPDTPVRWVMACPDVFSVRHTSVEAYLEPVVHEIKVSRADLLGDLKRPDKRAAYLAMGGACWYVLGQDARGRPIAAPDEVPAECGVMQREGERLHVLRPAPRRAVERLPFGVWMALARATPMLPTEDEAQAGLPPV